MVATVGAAVSSLPQLRVVSPWGPGEPLLVTLRGSGLVDATARARCIDAFRVFVAAAERGAFCVASPRARRIEASVLPRAGGQLKFALAGYAFGPQAFQVLRNLVADRDDGPSGVDEVTVAPIADAVHWPSVPPLPPPNDDDDLDEYPPVSSGAGIELVWEPVGGSWVRRCLVEYPSPPEAEEIDALSDWVEPWFELLELGGYALPIGSPNDVASARGGTVQFDEYSAELTVMRFEASEAAWAALINMIASRDAARRSMMRLTFD